MEQDTSSQNSETQSRNLETAEQPLTPPQSIPDEDPIERNSTKTQKIEMIGDEVIQNLNDKPTIKPSDADSDYFSGSFDENEIETYVSGKGSIKKSSSRSSQKLKRFMLNKSSDSEEANPAGGGLLNLDPRMLLNSSNESNEEEKEVFKPDFDNPLLEKLLANQAAQNKKVGLEILTKRIKQLANFIFTHPFNSKYLHVNMF